MPTSAQTSGIWKKNLPLGVQKIPRTFKTALGLFHLWKPLGRVFPRLLGGSWHLISFPISVALCDCTDLHSLRNIHAFSDVVRYAQDQNEAGHGYEEVDPDPVVERFDEGPYVILQFQRGDNGVGSRGYQRGKVDVLGLIPGPKEWA